MSTITEKEMLAASLEHSKKKLPSLSQIVNLSCVEQSKYADPVTIKYASDDKWLTEQSNALSNYDLSQVDQTGIAGLAYLTLYASPKAYRKKFDTIRIKICQTLLRKKDHNRKKKKNQDRIHPSLRK